MKPIGRIQRAVQRAVRARPGSAYNARFARLKSPQGLGAVIARARQSLPCDPPLRWTPLRDEKASSGLPLQPTDLPSLLTEQIAHLCPFLIVFATSLGSPLMAALLDAAVAE